MDSTKSTYTTHGTHVRITLRLSAMAYGLDSLFVQVLNNATSSRGYGTDDDVNE